MKKLGKAKVGKNINGWIIVDKPTGITSAAVVNKIKWAFDAKKAGHAGTLDPSATGILAIGLGEATKTIPYVTNQSKCYSFEVKWGEATNTDDSDGEITERSHIRPSEHDILTALPLFQGRIEQKPPLFSAVKINGRRAYELARKGENFDIAPRSLFVSSLKLEKYISQNSAHFTLMCGKGGYVRAIARDLGLTMGCYGHVTSLRRISSGSFDLSMATKLDDIIRLSKSPAINSLIYPLELGLKSIKQGTCTLSAAEKIKNGNSSPIFCTDAKCGEEMWVSYCEIPLAIGKYEGGLFLPKKVLNLTKSGLDDHQEIFER
jgi:tRNA pseudouridine55 synthase